MYSVYLLLKYYKKHIQASSISLMYSHSLILLMVAPPSSIKQGLIKDICSVLLVATSSKIQLNYRQKSRKVLDTLDKDQWAVALETKPEVSLKANPTIYLTQSVLYTPKIVFLGTKYVTYLSQVFPGHWHLDTHVPQIIVLLVYHILNSYR